MSWNYRVTHRKHRGQDLFSVEEVYYHKNGSIRGRCSASVDDWGTLAELESTLEKMAWALSEPVLEVKKSRSTKLRLGRP